MKLKPSLLYYYISIESRIYALSQEQYDEFKNMCDNTWDDALNYVKRVGTYQFKLDGNYWYDYDNKYN